LLLQRFTERPSRARLVLVSLAVGAVFLNDLTLGLFVLGVQMALILQTTCTWQDKVCLSTGTLIGSSIALSVWGTVLVTTLGLPVVTQDIAYTFLGRNASEAIASAQAVADFYTSHALVFWGHFVET